MAEVFPQADLYSLTMNPESGLDFGGRQVTTTFLDRIAPLKDRHALQLPMMPLAWRYATRRRYDVVVSSSHACAKGFWPGRSALHLCYCYTPMRYVWLSDLDRRKRPDPITRAGEKVLRAWDLRSVGWVDEFAGISNEVVKRIERYYHRPARLIFPPVDTDFYTPGDPSDKKDFALAVSRLVPYKRLDLAIRACAAVGSPLVIAGWGPQEVQLRELAAEVRAQVEFVTNPTDEMLRDLYRTARVSLFPAEEDFGIVAVESQACGTPVVALGRAGSLDTVVDGVTGAHIAEQTVGEMVAGIKRVFDGQMSAADCRSNAERFSAANFRTEFGEWVSSAAARAGFDLRFNGEGDEIA
ncbi:MAG TPA: glycosyltransferase [Actinomycetota bacterium]|nr:glycosyltransferase [Actinomycetota bacterium]